MERTGAGGVAVRAVSKQFESRAGRQTAISGVDLQIAPGQFVSLLGPSGCGKTSLLRIIGGLMEPSTGTVSVDGGSAANAVRARKFGFVFQDATLLPWRTVRANVLLPIDIAAASAQIGRGSIHFSHGRPVGFPPLRRAVVRRHAAARGARPRAGTQGPAKSC